MITVAIIVLFILVLIALFLIVLLNMKMARFKDLEIRQDRLMREMDDVIDGYLFAMREENNRLIEELKVQPTAPVMPKASVEPQMPKVAQEVTPRIDVVESSESPLFEPQKSLEQRMLVPKNHAAKAYKKNDTTKPAIKAEPTPSKTPIVKPVKEATFEEQVVALANEGMRAEDIAKKMQKGKTEIELLLKFHQ